MDFPYSFKSPVFDLYIYLDLLYLTYLFTLTSSFRPLCLPWPPFFTSMFILTSYIWPLCLPLTSSIRPLCLSWPLQFDLYVYLDLLYLTSIFKFQPKNSAPLLLLYPTKLKINKNIWYLTNSSKYYFKKFYTQCIIFYKIYESLKDF